MPESGLRPRSVHLARLILVVGSLAFVSALILWTADLRTLWPLYIVPIVVAALTYHAAGAVVTTAIVSALIALLTYGRGVESPTLPEIIVGMSAFLLSGIVIGVQAHRREQHSELLEEASAFDPLTGVFKPEHLSERLAEEVRRSERHNVSCSLALVMVQDFERFHEQFGRYKAELLLEHMADILSATVRETDVVGRFGPVTFGVVLPYSDAEGARVAMERVRAKVAVAQFEGDVLEPATHCAVAVAAATYPAEAPTGEGLVALAQARLAEAGGGGQQ